MRRVFIYIIFTILVCNSCASSNAIVSHDTDLSKYRYVVFGNASNGDWELDDMLMLVENEIAKKFQVISAERGMELLNIGVAVLSPSINVKTEKWDGGHTYIAINFYDYRTNLSVAIINSSGIGFSIAHDKKIALNAIRKKLNKTFK